MKKKVVVEYAERWASGGIESYILNIIKRLSCKKFNIRIVVAQKETDIYDKELENFGCHVEKILGEVQDNPIKRMIKNRKAFEDYFANNPCDVLHLHICQGVAMNYCKIAKNLGISKVITHCHNTEFGEGKYVIKLLGHNISKIIYRRYVDEMVACSDLAAKWLYAEKDILNKNVRIIRNIVEVDKFGFSPIMRKQLREQYNLCNKRVYISVGRMHYQKNQLFLMDIYRNIKEMDDNSAFILIGTGELKEKIKRYAKQIGIYENVIWIDETRNVFDYMSMSDIFLLPSLFEGNPVVGIEAQASGLKCFFSSTITRQAKILETVEFIDLKKGAVKWAEKLINSKVQSEKVRIESLNKVRNAGYNIKEQMKEIEIIYDSL